jgi:ribosomal-protein-alanine N-acetyltransferase
MRAWVHEDADDRHVEKQHPLRGAILRIRPFIPNDIPAIASIVREALRENYPTALYFDIHRWWREGFLVAELDGHPIGFLAAVNSAENQVRILMFAVATGFRRRGIGSMLMENFIQQCGNRDVRRVELEVRKSNLDGIRFYQRYGYEIASILPSFYTDGEDGIKMIKTLSHGPMT